MHGRSLGLLVAFLALPATAQAETVTIAGDAGPGSLRALVGQANTDPGPDFIDFADGLGPITLASSLAITDAAHRGRAGDGDPRARRVDARITVGRAVEARRAHHRRQRARRARRWTAATCWSSRAR